MAVITVDCQGSQWQDDFNPDVRRLYRYYARCFRGEHNADELRQFAMVYHMYRFMRYWKKGTTVRIATFFIVRHARAGRCGNSISKSACCATLAAT